MLAVIDLSSRLRTRNANQSLLKELKMTKERILTCIVCPRGCTLKVAFDESGRIADISGNACKRGAAYAEDECTHPRRTVTSTARLVSGGVISVKTSGTVPKENVFDVMKEINSVRVSDGIKIGDSIIKNVFGTGVDVVVTSNRTNE